MGQEIVQAASEQNWGRVKELIEQGAKLASLEQIDNHGTAPLHYAAKYGHIDTIELLTKAGADPDQYTTKPGLTPLHIALRSDKPAAVKALLEANARAEQQTIDSGESALHLAAGLGDDESFTELLAHHKKINQQDLSGRTPLDIAASHNRDKMVQALLDKGATGYPVRLAALHGSTKAVQVLLAHQDKIDPDVFSAEIDLALFRGIEHKEVTDALLEVGANPNSVFKETLERHNALRSKMGPTEEAVCEAGKAPYIRPGEHPLHCAARLGPAEAVKSLIGKGADVNALDAKGNSPLILASLQWGSDLSSVAVLLQAGADPNLTTVVGRTAIQMAMARANTKIAAYLMSVKGIVYDPDLKSELFHLAAQKGDTETINWLLEAGHDVNELRDNTSALHKAVCCVRDDVVLALLKASADPNLVGASNDGSLVANVLAQTSPGDSDSYGSTYESVLDSPLHITLLKGNVSATKVLLEYGANPNQPNNRGILPYTLVENDLSCDKQAKLLLSYGAKPPARFYLYRAFKIALSVLTGIISLGTLLLLRQPKHQDTKGVEIDPKDLFSDPERAVESTATFGLFHRYEMERNLTWQQPTERELLVAGVDVDKLPQAKAYFQ